MPDQATLELRIRVRYDLNGTDPQRLVNRLLDFADFGSEEGLLSGSLDAEVDAVRAEVIIVGVDRED